MPVYDQARLILTSISIAALCCLLMGLMGCGQPAQPVSYEELCGLPSQQIGTMSDEEVRRWIEEEHGRVQTVVLPAGLLPETGADSITTYGWAERRGMGTAYVRDGRLFRVTIRYAQENPTFGQVVAGLGEPEMLGRGAALYGTSHWYLRFELDYLELGVSVEGWREMTVREASRPYDEIEVTLRDDMRADSVSCYPPSLSLEEALRDVFFVRPAGLPHALDSRMPWPGFGVSVPLVTP